MIILTKDTGLPVDAAEPMTLPLSDEVRALIQEMIATSMQIGGYGLAAPQIGVNKQLFVYRTSSDGSNYKVVINPKVLVSSGKVLSRNEGCLSAPDVRKDIKRYKTFKISCVDETGSPAIIRPLTKRASIIIQHEYDHLLGKTILDR